MDGTAHEQNREVDALVVGAGFSGIYSLYKLRKELDEAVAIEKAAGMGTRTGQGGPGMLDADEDCNNRPFVSLAGQPGAARGDLGKQLPVHQGRVG